jgi:hypothetical protein
MSELFGREYQLDIGDISYKSDGLTYPLQIAGSIDTGFDSTNSTAEIRIHNLSNDDKQRILSFIKTSPGSNQVIETETVTLQAGYPGLLGPIFSGELVNAIETVDPPERYLTLYCRDSAKATIESIYNNTHSNGTEVEAVIRDVAASFGLPVLVVGDISTYGTVVSGLTESGNSKDVLNRLAASYGFTWTIVTGTVQIRTDVSPAVEPVAKLSAATGMIGSPEVDHVGVKVNSKINPNLRVGKSFQVDSLGAQFNFSDVYYQNVPVERINGTFTARSVSYELDYYGDKWDMKVTGWASG